MFVPRQGFLKVRTLWKMLAQLIDGSVKGFQSMVFGLAVGKRSRREVGFDFFKCSDGSIWIKRLAERMAFGFDNMNEHIECAEQGES